jgi:membrane-bound serine protease (ClpP class)
VGRHRTRAWGLGLVALALALWSSLALALATDEVLLVDVDGPIGPAAAEHVRSALDEAAQQGAPAVLLRIDTPGGLDTSMRHIVREIVASPVPVIGYVAPSGARAASAGTYIMMATHVAAMAPATTLGAATPVAIGGPSPAPEGDAEPATPDAMERKIVEDARAYMRGLANLRGRNAQWADRAVLEGASATASEAVRDNVVDLVADDIDELLRATDGRTVDVLGLEVTLRTAGLAVTAYEASWRIRLLSIIGDPNVAYLLLMLGMYGLLFELANPGLFVPGIVGAICLILALFALATLPVNWAGLALILLGVGLMVAEVFVSSVGVLGVGGVAAFVVGSIILMDTDSEFFQLSIGLVIGITIASALIFIGVVRLVLKSRRGRVVSGREELAGSLGEALETFDQTGRVRTHGEIWQAHTETPVREGQRVRIRAARGLTLEVEPAPELDITHDDSLHTTSERSEEIRR